MVQANRAHTVKQELPQRLKDIISTKNKTMARVKAKQDKKNKIKKLWKKMFPFGVYEHPVRSGPQFEFTYVPGVPGSHDVKVGRKVHKKYLKSKVDLRSRRNRAKEVMTKLMYRYRDADKAKKRRQKTGVKARGHSPDTEHIRKKLVKVYNYGSELTKRYAQNVRKGKFMAITNGKDILDQLDEPMSKTKKFMKCEAQTHKKRGGVQLMAEKRNTPERKDAASGLKKYRKEWRSGKKPALGDVKSITKKEYKALYKRGYRG